YQEFSYDHGVGFFEVSNDGGVNWTPSTTGINVGTATPDNAQQFPPFALDPSNPNRLVLGTSVVYVTTNQGVSWTAISAADQFGAGATITSIAVARSAPNTIYVTTSIGQVWVTSNNGGAWTQVSVPGVTDSLTGLVVDPNNANTAYVVRNA